MRKGIHDFHRVDGLCQLRSPTTRSCGLRLPFPLPLPLNGNLSHPAKCNWKHRTDRFFWGPQKSCQYFSYCWWKKSGDHQLIGRLSHYLRRVWKTSQVVLAGFLQMYHCFQWRIVCLVLRFGSIWKSTKSGQAALVAFRQTSSYPGKKFWLSASHILPRPRCFGTTPED